ncbi:S-layer homology domain-containing protein [Intestinimonas butyriciproducens]|uniref:S-layer homology domain-containing protein n=1 Tax=Intestinimonas butyriciproducens TaxID=1297617 RepID=UPI003AEF452C
MKKRILSMLLVLVMVLGMFPMSAMAAETENSLAVTNVIYGIRVDGETVETTVTPTKLETSVTVTNGSNTVTPENMYFVEIHEQSVFSLNLILNGLIDFMGNIQRSPKSGGTEYSYMGANNLNEILVDENTTFTGFEKEAGCTYYFATSLDSSQQFNNKLGVIICVNPNGGSQEPENNAPALANGVSAEATEEIEAGSAYTVDLSTIFVDADNDTLTYTVAIDGAGAEATSKDYSKTFDTAGDYTLVFTATDGKASVTYTVSLTVNPNGGAQEPENTMAVTGVTYNNGKAATVKKLDDSITVNVPAIPPFVPANSITPQNVYLVEINEELNAADIVITTNEAMQLGGVFGGGFKYDLGTEFTLTSEYRDEYYLIPGENNVTVTGFEMEDGCTYYFLTSASVAMFEDPVFDNKLGVIICVNPNGGAQEPENTMAVTGVTYNNGKTAAVTKLENSITVNVPAIPPFVPESSITPEETYLVEINEELSNADIVIETSEAMQLGSVFGGFNLEADTVRTLTSDSRNECLIPGENNVTVTGFEMEDGCTYYFLTSGTADYFEQSFDNKLGILICVKPVAVNHAPTLAPGIYTGVTDEQAVNTPYTLDLSTIFTDADNDELTYTVAVGEAEAEATSKDYSKTFDTAGDYTLVFTATDGKASVTYTVTVTVYELTAVDITTQEELAEFMTNAREGQIGTLKNDLALSGWKSYDEEFGGALFKFRGTLDGAGHTITIDSTCHTLCLENQGIIKNLTLAGELEISNLSRGNFCTTNRGTITNCKNTIAIVNTGDNINPKGGICAINYGEISNCYNTGSITGQFVGGIAGENHGTIENCFNTGLVTAEQYAGGIVHENHTGTVRNCYNFGLVHHYKGWDTFYGSYIENELGPVVGDNIDASFNAGSGLSITNEGTTENVFYLDAYDLYKAYGSTLTAELSELYLTEKIVAPDWQGRPVHAICGWKIPTDQTVFAENTTYYAYYDASNDHFIVVQKDASAESNIIDALNPGTEYVVGTSACSENRNFYLVKVPEDANTVKFKNTEQIVNYSLGYTNAYLNANLLLDHAGTSYSPDYSEKFIGTAITEATRDNVLAAVEVICGSDTETAAYVEKLLGGVKKESNAEPDTPSNPGEDNKIDVTFRLIGATLSPSGNYDLGANPPVKDSEYVTWIATKSYTVDKNTTAGELLIMALTDAGMRADGIENNYIANIYAPDILGGYELAEFTNGFRSGWMYSINGKHPEVGVNGYYLKDGDAMIFHYINDYSYECSDWFKNDQGYPNLGDASTWDPWLKVADKNPTKDTPTVGVGGQTNKAVDNVIDLIDAIGTVTKDSDNAIKAARTAYDALTDNQKELVSNYSTLVAAEKKYAELTGKIVFTDVSEDAYYYEAVKWAVENGITMGTGEDTFSPEASCTRAQMVTFLWRAAGEPKAESTTCVFTDVDKDAYYYEALLWAVENGITSGTSATTFSPNASCTRGQMATFLYRDAKSPAVTGTHAFTDVKADAYYNNAVIWAAAEGITVGTSDTTFSPDEDCTRGQMVTFLWRYLAK